MCKQPEAIAQVEVTADDAEAKLQRKAAKKAAKEAAAALPVVAEEPMQVEIDDAEAKKQRKAAKSAKKAADAAKEEAPELVVPEAAVDEAEAKRLRKAAKKAERAAVEVPETIVTMEVDEDEAKRQRKAAKKAAKEAAAATVDEACGTNIKAEKAKRSDAADGEETPAPKKVKKDMEETPAPTSVEVSDTKGKGKGKERNNENTVMVRGLPFAATDETLKKDFGECGEIETFKLPLSEEGTSRGFCFIKYSAQAGVDAALKFDNTDYGGRTIFVSKAGENGNGQGKDGGKGKGKDGKGKDGKGNNENTVFIRGLPFTATEDQLKKHFGECGEVETFRLPLNEEGNPRGICFVKYTAEAGVDAALKFDNTEYGGRTINVSKAGEGGKGKDGKGKGKDGKGKDGKGKNGKAKGKGKAPSAAFARGTGCIVESAGEKKTFDDSDDE